MTGDLLAAELARLPGYLSSHLLLTLGALWLGYAVRVIRIARRLHARA